MTAARANGHADLLLRYGRFYGEQHLAVTFTASITGEEAKRVLVKGWDKTKPLADGDYGAAYVAGRGANRNPVVVLRPSNLVVLECDTEADLVRIQSLNLPMTVTVRSSADYKRHFWFRPPRRLEALPYVAFRFESGKLTADSGRYFLCPPAIHPNGQQYGFLPELGPDDVDIAELPEPIYRELSELARVEDEDLRERIAIDPEAKIKAGKRREMIFRYACMLRRWGLSEQEILDAGHKFNVSRCHPPVEHHLVAVQVDGAMKMTGDQEIETALLAEPPFELAPLSALELCEEPDLDTGQLLGPLVVSGGRTIIVGDTGEGKTSLTLQLVRAILRGDDFLGWEGQGEGHALIIDLEQGRKSVKRSLREAGLADARDVDLVLVPDGLSLEKDEKHKAELDRVIAEGGYTIVVLDPYYKAHRSEEPNAERPIVDLMRVLDGMRTNYGFALILPAHPRKELPGAGAVRKLTIHDIAGSGAIVRGAEVVLGIERVAHGFARIRFLKDREGDLPIDEAWKLLYSKDEGFFRDPKDLEPDTDYQQKIQDVDDAKWRTLKEWKKMIGSGETAAENALSALLEEGFVEYAERGHDHRKGAKCWRLITALGAPGHLGADKSLASHEQLTALVPSPSIEGTKGAVSCSSTDIGSELPQGTKGRSPLDETDIPF